MLGLFDTLEDKGHRVGLDNPYMSARFCKEVYIHPSKVLLHGVTRKGGRGLPVCVIQEEKERPEDKAKARGTVKLAVLEGDDDCPNLVAASVYDQKPVHFLSMACKDVKWIVKERSVWDPQLKNTVKIKFLRLNINDEYNNEMNDVDISDQLRTVYRFDRWIRITKWWWAFFYWGLGTLMVNAYVSYRTFLTDEGVPKSQLLSHYDFRRAIALAWLDPENFWPGFHKFCESEYGTKRRRTETRVTSEEASATTRSTTKKKRETPPYCARVNDKALCPMNGALKDRLQVIAGHWPRPVEHAKAPRCQVHRWAGVEHKAGIYCCAACNVNLCIACFEMFHTQADIVQNKEELRKRFEEEKEAMRTPTS